MIDETRRAYQKQSNKIMLAAGELRKLGYDVPQIFRAIANEIEKTKPPTKQRSAEIILIRNYMTLDKPTKG